MGFCWACADSLVERNFLCTSAIAASSDFVLLILGFILHILAWIKWQIHNVLLLLSHGEFWKNNNMSELIRRTKLPAAAEELKGKEYHGKCLCSSANNSFLFCLCYITDKHLCTFPFNFQYIPIKILSYLYISFFQNHIMAISAVPPPPNPWLWQCSCWLCSDHRDRDPHCCHTCLQTQPAKNCGFLLCLYISWYSGVLVQNEVGCVDPPTLQKIKKLITIIIIIMTLKRRKMCSRNSCITDQFKSEGLY